MVQIHTLLQTKVIIRYEIETKVSSSRTVNDGNSGRWTKAEHLKFLEGLKLYGKNWRKIQLHVGTRTTTQARSHAQKYFARLQEKGEKEEVENSEFIEDFGVSSNNLDVTLKQNIDKSVKLLESNVQEIKRRLKGPYKPGKRHIRCGNLKEIIPKKVNESNSYPLSFIILHN